MRSPAGWAACCAKYVLKFRRYRDQPVASHGPACSRDPTMDAPGSRLRVPGWEVDARAAAPSPRSLRRSGSAWAQGSASWSRHSIRCLRLPATAITVVGAEIRRSAQLGGCHSGGGAASDRVDIPLAALDGAKPAPWGTEAGPLTLHQNSTGLTAAAAGLLKSRGSSRCQMLASVPRGSPVRRIGGSRRARSRGPCRGNACGR